MENEGRGGRLARVERSLADYTVYDVHYEKIGKVDDVFVDEDDRPKYLGVKMGLLGTRTTLIPGEIVRVNDKRRLVEVAAEKDAVKEGPTFGDDREITPDFERRVLGYYGAETDRIEPAQTSTDREAYGAHYSGIAGGDERVDLRTGERMRERERGGDLGGEEELRVRRVEEDLEAGTREREAGAVNVRKRVRTDRERLAVPKKRQEARVDRVPVEGREASEAEIGEDEVRVPVIEEEIVVEKRPVVKEEIRLRKEVVEEEEVIEEDVRKEEVEIDDRTGRRGDPGHVEGMDETARYSSEEAREEVEPEERREKQEASVKKNQQRVANTKAAKRAQKGLPIRGYDELTVEEAKGELDGLSEGELKKIRAYEKGHKNRKTLLEQLDRKIEDAS